MIFLIDLGKGASLEPAPHEETDKLHIVFSDQHGQSAN